MTSDDGYLKAFGELSDVHLSTNFDCYRGLHNSKKSRTLGHENSPGPFKDHVGQDYYISES